MGLGGKCRDKHVTDGVCFDKSKTDSEKQFLRILPGNVEVAAENLYVITVQLVAQSLELGGKGCFPDLHQLLLVAFKIVYNHVACMPGLEELEPILLRMLVFSGDDLDLVSSPENMGQGDKPHIDLGGNSLVADLGVDAVREIKGCGPFLYGFLLSLRREDGDLAAGQVVMDYVKELESVHVRADQNLFHLGQPLVHLAVILAQIAFLLICPMGGDSLLGYIIHPLGTDLYLDPYSLVAHQGAVESLIAVALRVFYPIPYPVWIVSVNAGDYGENMVALVPLSLLRPGVRSENNPQGV